MAGLATARHLATYHPTTHSSGGSEDASSPSPGVTTPPPSPSPGGKSSSLLETPTRKNKRKLSEPKKRGTDFSIKRLCPDSPGGSAMSESGCSDDGAEDNNGAVRRTRPARRRLSHERDDSSSRGPSEREDTPVPSSSNGHVPGASHHPFFPAGLPTTACFMPGFYLTDGRTGFPPPPFQALPLGLPHPGFPPLPEQRVESLHGQGHSSHQALKPQDLSRGGAESPDNLSGDDSAHGSSGGRKPRKNYKNMTRERRVEANARERTRVHTISAAFEALRRAVPSYSYNQKLSKLAILRIACTYIMALARLADVDCSNITEPIVPDSFADCVDLCTRTIQTEGRARRRH
ncbi:uncharacterized protein LOC143291863 [Babylonia areolata]|uniref:uncharacterized protein LOC143291863 n=1 Tax=Babylonia areolata TaxID=304850 RepID=UPI003FCFD83A